MSSRKWGEVRFYWLLMEVLAGRRMISELLEHSEFECRGKEICRCYARVPYDWMELFQDSCLKVLGLGDRFRLDNVPDEDAFFNWYSVLTINLRNDYFRRNRRRLEQETSLGEDEARQFDIADPCASPYEDCLFKERVASLGRLSEGRQRVSEGRQRALTLRRAGFTYQEIAEQLTVEGFEGCTTKVTARKWVMDCLDVFFEDSHTPLVRKAVG